MVLKVDGTIDLTLVPISQEMVQSQFRSLSCLPEA